MASKDRCDDLVEFVTNNHSLTNDQILEWVETRTMEYDIRKMFGHRLAYSNLMEFSPARYYEQMTWRLSLIMTEMASSYSDTPRALRSFSGRSWETDNMKMDLSFEEFAGDDDDEDDDEIERKALEASEKIMSNDCVSLHELFCISQPQTLQSV